MMGNGGGGTRVVWEERFSGDGGGDADPPAARKDDKQKGKGKGKGKAKGRYGDLRCAQDDDGSGEFGGGLDQVRGCWRRSRLEPRSLT
jgi:hypothetical protein